MARAARHDLGPDQADAARGMDVEIQSADVRQDGLVPMAGRELAEAASPVVDADFELVARRLDSTSRPAA